MMLITKDNLTELKIGQEIYEATSEFKMINKFIYLGIHNVQPTNKNCWLKHIFFNTANTFSFSADLECTEDRHLPKVLRRKALFTTYDEACRRSRSFAIAHLNIMNDHQFQKNPIKAEK